MNRLMGKLKKIFTAMAYAEAGDLDAVKQVLQEEPGKLKSEQGEGKDNPQQPVLPAM